MKTLYNSSGMTLVQVLVVAGILPIIGLAMAKLMTTHSQIQFDTSMKTSMLALRQNILGTQSNFESWRVTRQRNAATMSCQSSLQQFCNPSQPTERALINLYDAQGNLVLDSNSPTAGFSPFGEPCNTFNLTVGNDACPIKVTFSWRALCTATTCTPSIAATGNFIAEELIGINFFYRPRLIKTDVNTLNFNLVEQSRLRLLSNDAPAIACAAAGMIFIGPGRNFNGQSSNQQGCISYSAFMGPTGPQGIRGPAGRQGPAGAQGPSAVCP